MSFKAFVWAWDQPVESATHQHVLLALADIAPNREVKASAQYIATKTRRSVRAVGMALSALEASGLIEREERPGRVDLIRLNIPPEFSISFPPDGDLEGPRGRPKKPPQDLKTPAASEENPRNSGGKPPSNSADEPKPNLEGEPRPPVGGLAAEPARSDARIAFDHYNALAERHGWERALVFGRDRQRHIRARIADANGLKGFVAYLDDIENSPFLMGRTSGAMGAFKISLGFLLQPSSFTKLMEGFYHRGRTNGSGSTPGAYDPTSARNHGRTASMFAGAALAAGGRAPLDDPGRG